MASSSGDERKHSSPLTNRTDQIPFSLFSSSSDARPTAAENRDEALSDGTHARFLECFTERRTCPPPEEGSSLHSSEGPGPAHPALCCVLLPRLPARDDDSLPHFLDSSDLTSPAFSSNSLRLSFGCSVGSDEGSAPLESSSLSSSCPEPSSPPVKLTVVTVPSSPALRYRL